MDDIGLYPKRQGREVEDAAVRNNEIILLRGTLVNRTYGVHKNLYIKPFLLTIFGPVNYAPP